MGDRLATVDMGRKEGCCAPFGGGELGPRLTQSGHGPRSISMSSCILIRPTVFLATITNVTDRQTYNGPIA